MAVPCRCGIPPVVRFRTCRRAGRSCEKGTRRRWFVSTCRDDRRMRLGLTSAGCVADAIPPEWFPDTPGDFGAPHCGLWVRGDENQPGALLAELSKLLLQPQQCAEMSYLSSQLSQIVPVWGVAAVAPRSFAATVARNGADGSPSQGRVEVVLSSPATEGGASPSRPDERARLEPRAPVIVADHPAAVTRLPSDQPGPPWWGEVAVDQQWRSPAPSRRKDPTCRPGQARQRR